jgi:hypothetical protein
VQGAARRLVGSSQRLEQTKRIDQAPVLDDPTLLQALKVERILEKTATGCRIGLLAALQA